MYGCDGKLKIRSHSLTYINSVEKVTRIQGNDMWNKTNELIVIIKNDQVDN